MIGQQGVGKTTLLAHFIERKFHERTPATNGLKQTKYQQKNGPEDVINIHFWDFSGRRTQRIFQEAYLKQSDVICLVVDINQPDALSEATTILKLLNKIDADTSEIILTINLFNEDKSKIPEAEIKSFVVEHKIEKLVYVDAKEQEQVDDFFKIVISDMINTRRSSKHENHGCPDNHLQQKYIQDCDNKLKEYTLDEFKQEYQKQTYKLYQINFVSLDGLLAHIVDNPNSTEAKIFMKRFKGSNIYDKLNPILPFKLEFYSRYRNSFTLFNKSLKKEEQRIRDVKQIGELKKILESGEDNTLSHQIQQELGLPAIEQKPQINNENTTI